MADYEKRGGLMALSSGIWKFFYVSQNLVWLLNEESMVKFQTIANVGRVLSTKTFLMWDYRQNYGNEWKI